jgi:hypothetical protein
MRLLEEGDEAGENESVHIVHSLRTGLQWSRAAACLDVGARYAILEVV